MAIDRSSQPLIASSANVLVGVAQVRVGKSSIRDTGTAAIGTVTAVGQSDKFLSTVDNTTYVVRPKVIYAANTGTASISVTGTYIGKWDGCIIIRAVDASNVNVFAPNNYMKTTAAPLSSYSVETASGVASGLTIDGTFTGMAAGDTWVIPIWSGVAQNKNQTGIVSPFSMFNGASNSVGGLKSAEFTPKVNSTKQLAVGFPEIVVDKVIDSTSVTVGFESLEYTNANMATLKDIMRRIINEGTIASTSCEVVMRTRGNTLVTFWIPSVSMSSFPSYSPTNDFSTVKWELEALKQTQIVGESEYYNAALEESYIYNELLYSH